VTVAPAFVKTLAETGKKLKVIQWSDYGFDGYGLSRPPRPSLGSL
jgi:NitT/TauT family transport system substrate-binding protein